MSALAIDRSRIVTEHDKCVLVVSDLHCGSVFGLLPPNFETSSGAHLAQNASQRYLWECWMDMVEWAARMPVVALIVNGDMIDGRQDKQHGSELALPLPGDQGQAAIQALTVLRKRLPLSHKLFILQGTEYHDGLAGKEADTVAQLLGATQYRGLGTGRYTREVLDLDIDGVAINFAHHVGTTMGMYRGTAIDKESLFATLAAREGKHIRCDALIRAHAHHFVHEELPHKHGVIGPCWQLQTRFMRKKSVYRMIPDIGWVALWVDPAAKKAGMDPIRVEKRIYSLPPATCTRL